MRTLPIRWREKTIVVSEHLVLSRMWQLMVLDPEPAKLVWQLSDAMLIEQAGNAERLLTESQVQWQNHSHPNVEWMIQDVSNYQWVYELYASAVAEHKYRIPYSALKVDVSLEHPPAHIPSKYTVSTVPPFFLPPEYQIPTTIGNHREWMNLIKSFRAYYMWELWNIQETWTNRPVPEWIDYDLQMVRDTIL